MKIFYTILVMLAPFVTQLAWGSEIITGKFLSAQLNSFPTEKKPVQLLTAIEVLTHGEYSLPSSDNKVLVNKIIVAECKESPDQGLPALYTMIKAYIEGNWDTIVEADLVQTASSIGVPSFKISRIKFPTPNNDAMVEYSCRQ